MKHSFECLMKLLKALIIVSKIQSKSVQNFMIKLLGSHIQTSFTVVYILLFYRHELLMNLRIIYICVGSLFVC